MNKYTLKQCLEIRMGLVTLSESKMLGLQNAYAVAHNMRSLEGISSDFEETRRVESEKLQKLADEEGNVKKEVYDKFAGELTKLLEKDHKVDLKKLDFTGMDEIDVTAQTLAQVMDILDYAK